MSQKTIKRQQRISSRSIDQMELFHMYRQLSEIWEKVADLWDHVDGQKEHVDHCYKTAAEYLENAGMLLSSETKRKELEFDG
jgi:hypothetical protein